jgi:hypothetical protein
MRDEGRWSFQKVAGMLEGVTAFDIISTGSESMYVNKTSNSVTDFNILYPRQYLLKDYTSSIFGGGGVPFNF